MLKAPTKTRLAALALIGGLALLPAASLQAQSADSILPGYWESKVKALGLTVDNDFWCVKPNEIDKFLNGPCNRHHTCAYPVRVVGGGKARFEGYWQNKEGKRAQVAASGEYTAKHFVMRTKPTRGTNGVPIPAVTFDATWVSATCKPGAKTPR